ncbi:MAG TPA: polysaccharide deacetylase family protein [Gaiellaceae bacterium]
MDGSPDRRGATTGKDPEDDGRQRRPRRVSLALGVALIAFPGAALAVASGPAAPHAARRTQPPPAPARLRATSHRTRTSVPARVRVPILVYHVIAQPFRDSPFPGLYVPPAQFRAQMSAVSRAGFHAVTLDQVERSWSDGPALPPHPVVISFDNGYRTQYTRALPVLRRLGWVGVENLQLQGLPPSQGGLGPAEVRALVAAGWELDTQGFSHADLPSLDAAALRHELAVARAELRRRYGVPVNWFCYPSGEYDRAVVAEARRAGYVGATTILPGWAAPREDRYRLPRLRVLRGTTPAALLAEIADARLAPPPPAAHV